MSNNRLVPCAACARHVRASEAACPFCRAELPRSLRDAAPPRPPGMRLGRAGLKYQRRADPHRANQSSDFHHLSLGHDSALRIWIR